MTLQWYVLLNKVKEKIGFSSFDITFISIAPLDIRGKKELNLTRLIMG